MYRLSFSLVFISFSLIGCGRTSTLAVRKESPAIAGATSGADSRSSPIPQVAGGSPPVQNQNQNQSQQNQSQNQSSGGSAAVSLPPPQRELVEGTGLASILSVGVNWHLGKIVTPHSKGPGDFTDGGNIEFSKGGTIWGHSSNELKPIPLVRALGTDHPADVATVSVCERRKPIHYGLSPIHGWVAIPPEAGGTHWIDACESFRNIQVFAGACPRRALSFECVGVNAVGATLVGIHAIQPGEQDPNFYGLVCKKLELKSVCVP